MTPEQWALDAKWEPVARGALVAMRALGYDAPDCLPGDPEQCGGTFAQHAMASLGALHALADHHLKHMGEFGKQADEVRGRIAADLDRDPACQLHADHGDIEVQ